MMEIMLKLTRALLSMIFLVPFAITGQDTLVSRFSSTLNALCAGHHEEQLQAAFGTFTFEYSDLATPFSRWIEDQLIRAVPRSPRIRLFNRAAASAMDDSFRKLYADFFASNQVDALLSGKYFVEQDGIRVRFDLTSLRNGNLIGSEELLIEQPLAPASIAIVPDTMVVETAKRLSGFLPGRSSATERIEALKLSLSTERGPGGAYRTGENLRVLVTVDQESYLKLYHVDVKGTTKLIWPNRFGGGEGKIAAGTALTIPGLSDPFAFLLGEPYGTEFIKAIASTVPFSHIEDDFQDLGTDSRDVIARGLELSQTAEPSIAHRAEALASYVIAK